jgi:hypothetical protein
MAKIGERKSARSLFDFVEAVSDPLLVRVARECLRRRKDTDLRAFEESGGMFSANGSPGTSKGGDPVPGAKTPECVKRVVSVAN